MTPLKLDCFDEPLTRYAGVSYSLRGSGCQWVCMAVGSLGRDRAVSSRQLRRRTIAPGRGEGRALRFVPSEVPHGPHGPPTAMCGASG